VLPLVEVKVRVGATLSSIVAVPEFEVFPLKSLANPPARVTTSLCDTLPDFVALKVTPVPLNSGVVAVQPEDTSSPAVSFSVTDSLKVRDMFT
jgi:hypothetical protein